MYMTIVRKFGPTRHIHKNKENSAELDAMISQWFCGPESNHSVLREIYIVFHKDDSISQKDKDDSSFLGWREWTI